MIFLCLHMSLGFIHIRGGHIEFSGTNLRVHKRVFWLRHTIYLVSQVIILRRTLLKFSDAIFGLKGCMHIQSQKTSCSIATSSSSSSLTTTTIATRICAGFSTSVRRKSSQICGKFFHGSSASTRTALKLKALFCALISLFPDDKLNSYWRFDR